jgi:hypothetical protein
MKHNQSVIYDQPNGSNELSDHRYLNHQEWESTDIPTLNPLAYFNKNCYNLDSEQKNP